MLATQKVPKRVLPKLEKEIKMMLHACRDGLRNRFIGNKFVEDRSRDIYDPRKITFPADDGYAGEAFGILRAMACAGWGDYHGPVNVDKPGNLRYWFDKLEKEVLAEENFRFDFDPSYIAGDGSGYCEYCMARYGKDDKTMHKYAQG